MADKWPADTTQVSEAVRLSDLEAINLKIELTRNRALIQAAPQRRRAVHSLIKRIQDAIDVWDDAASLPGIVTYVRDSKNMPTLDVAASFAQMRSAAVALQTAIYNSFPRDPGSGALLMETDDAQGNITDLFFTVAQLAPLVSLIDDYSNSVTYTVT